MTLSTADILRKAKARIADPAMWHQGGLYEGCSPSNEEGIIPNDVPCCAVGAIEWAAGTADEKWTACGFVLDVIDKNQDISTFNDRPDTTHADIMAMFNRAIAKAEAEEGAA